MLRATPLSEAPRLPATAGLAGLAIATTALAWSGHDVEVLTMSYRAFEDQPWRLVTSALPHVGISALDEDDDRYADALAAEHTRLGFEAYERSDWDEAIAHHRAALEIGPGEDGERHHQLCLALLAAEQPALEACTRAHERAPNNAAFRRALAAAHRSLALDAWEREDWAGAVEHYGHARQLTGDSVDEYNAALASERAGDLATARRGFERALELDPASVPAADGAARTRAALAE